MKKFKASYHPGGKMFIQITEYFKKGCFDSDLIKKETGCTNGGYVTVFSFWLKKVQKKYNAEEEEEERKLISDGTENEMLKERVYQRKNVKPKDHRSLYEYEED